MESFPVFFKVRAVTFTCIIFISLLWTVLLSIEAYARWDVADSCSRALTAVFILTNTTTMLMLPFLLLLEFRMWLDAARVLLLMTLQIGSAAAFTYWNPQIQCPDRTADQLGVCKLINIYTLMACWIIPAILILYASFFSVMVYCQSQIPVVLVPRESPVSPNRQPTSPVMVDPEMGIPSPSLPAHKTRTSICPPRISSINSLPFSQQRSNSVSPLTISVLPSPVSCTFHPVVFQPGANLQSSHRHASLTPSFMNSPVQTDSASATYKSGRLSKPPHWHI